jgi:hypothetical protein
MTLRAVAIGAANDRAYEAIVCQRGGLMADLRAIVSVGQVGLTVRYACFGVIFLTEIAGDLL